MQTLIERGCGLDVHQATVVACLLMVRRDGKVQKQMRTFGTTTRELVGLREWLLSEGCSQVARKLVESQAAERNRLLKVLETANIKLANVATDVFGMSGRLMLRALIAGKATPQEMALPQPQLKP